MGGRCLTRERHKRAYDCWVNMKQRCNNPRNPVYEYYGARGISYHPDWEIFSNFLADMGDPPEELTLERLNNDEGYSKENCEWATRKEQTANRRPQRTRSDSASGIKGVSIRKDGYIIALSDQKSGQQLLYAGRSLEDAVNARKKWEVENP